MTFLLYFERLCENSFLVYVYYYESIPNYNFSDLTNKLNGTMALKRGALIVFEGCDRSGKTTQIKRLVERLNQEGTKTK